jgi:hypothetical protein
VNPIPLHGKDYTRYSFGYIANRMEYTVRPKLKSLKSWLPGLDSN